MAPRLELHDKLKATLGSDFVYFQPPSNLTIQYPCIVYAHDNAMTEFAGNLPYSRAKRYQVTHISRNPDTEIPDKLGLYPLSNLNRVFIADNLHHYVFNIYF
ncbi:tail terminator [Streptomyces phage RosaAsantewaa]|nr:tail terminator [Streptomyces phage RosaAsantewaa]